MSQALMELEAQQLSRAEKPARMPARTNYREGYREWMWKTRVGGIDRRISRLRNGTYFFPPPGTPQADGKNLAVRGVAGVRASDLDP